MFKFISIIFFLLLLSLSSKAKILEKDYVAIFTKYKVNNRDVVQRIINKCIKETGRDSLGRENLTITTNNNGEKVIDHKNEKAFLSCTYTGILKVIKPSVGNSLKKNAVEDLLLNNEISISVDGFRGASRRFVFEEKGYTRYDSLATLGTTDGWRWSKTGQLRVFMDGKKTTWRISKDLNALSIKYSKDKTINYFLSYEKKLFAKKRREKEQKISEAKKIAEEKRKEEERKKAEEKKLAEEKRKEEERLAEEKRKEEERLAEEKRKEEERLAEEKRKEEEAKLQEIFSKYNASNQFQKDLVRTLLRIPGINLENIKFSRGDRLIEADFAIKNKADFIGVSGLQLKNLNKNVFYKLVENFENFDFFLERKWFDEISINNLSFNVDGSTFNSSIILRNLEFKEFTKNLDLITKISKKTNSFDKNTENGIAALMSLSLKDVIFKDLSFNDRENNWKISFDYCDIKGFSLFDWGRWSVKNYKDQDKKTNTEVSYEYSDLKNIIFDKSEIMKYAQSYNPATFNFDNDYKIFFNFLNSLGSGVTRNIVVKDLSTKNKIATASSVSLNSLKFDYIDNNRDQKSLTEFDVNFTGLDLSVNEISPEFSNYFTLMGYDNIKFDFGTSLKWVTTKNILNFDINLGITNAADLKLKTTFSGLSAEALSINNEAALGAYLLSNFKLNNLSLSLIDNSLRDNILKLAAAESKMTINEFKREIINLINTYTATANQTNLFNQYKSSVVKFINGSKKIVVEISPKTPVSLAEVSPYFLAMDYNQIIRVLNLSIKN